MSYKISFYDPKFPGKILRSFVLPFKDVVAAIQFAENYKGGQAYEIKQLDSAFVSM